MENRPQEELKVIAKDIHHGSVFTDRHCHGSQEARMVFMPLSLMSREAIEKLHDDPPALIFEYLDKAGPMAVNGLPTFFSCQMMNKHDAEIVSDLIDKLRLAEKEALE